MASKVASKKFKWGLDFNTKPRSSNSDIPAPPGYNPSADVVSSKVSNPTDQSHLILKKSWEIALGPIKQFPMNLVIMYMSGNSISIFPIMMVVMMFIRPVKSILATHSTFRVIEGVSATGQKLVFLLGNLVNVGLALYKCHSMGLLPTHASDWLAFVEPQARLEYSGGGISLF
ncbi:ER membrane protein complex subunit 4-like [Anopheles albimanus]|uniref:ER membrane protein complex subunit 4 n=1 Tax=Anopheles albimanus TaxID=7167 RepID=A0A182FUK8_ANOAL|nr:ER membrane protein complex subunit 4-like [Anopheles albimanus]